MTSSRSSLWLRMLWVAPWMVGLALFYAVPLAMSLFFSLTDATMIEPPRFIGLDNYAALARDRVFWRCVANTAIYAAVAIPLAMILSLWLAALLSTRHALAKPVLLLVFAPTVVPLVAASMIWLWIFNSDHGLLNMLFTAAGATGPNWLTTHGWAMSALIIMSLWSVGQSVVIYLAALRDVPRPLIESASLEGLGRFRRFVHVVLPTIAPAILFNAIIQTITAWQVFAAPYIMTGGGPDRSTYFYSHYVYDQAFVFQHMGYAATLGWVQCLLLAVCIGAVYLCWRRLGDLR